MPLTTKLDFWFAYLSGNVCCGVELARASLRGAQHYSGHAVAYPAHSPSPQQRASLPPLPQTHTSIGAAVARHAPADWPGCVYRAPHAVRWRYNHPALHSTIGQPPFLFLQDSCFYSILLNITLRLAL